MNKKFLAILVLLSAIPGCVWGPRYQCNAPCNQSRTTCYEAPAQDCYQETTPATTCYEDTMEQGTTCYEATGTEANPNVEYCYEATDYPTMDVVQQPTETYNYETEYADDATQGYDETTQDYDFDYADYAEGDNA